MNKYFSALALAVTVVTATFSQNVIATDIAAGEQIFSANCAACQLGGKNLIIPEKTLAKDVLAENGMNSVDAITTQVTNGKGAMPAFGGRLESDDINNVANYVLSQSESGWD